MNQNVLLVIFLFLSVTIYSQKSISNEGDSTDLDSLVLKTLPEFIVTKDFNRQYRRTLNRVRKVYPLALYTKELIIEIDNQLDSVNKKKQQRTIKKNAQKELEDKFTYVIRDMYTSEGIMLMKLIHRETGMTVSEILKKYKGGMKSEMYSALAKVWGQNMDAIYDPSGEDWITEIIINEIQREEINFTYEPQILTKEEFKASQKNYRQLVKESRKKKRKEKRKK